MSNITYYTWPQCPFCQRVTICLEEKNLKHNDKIINLLRYQNFDPEFVKKNDLCLVPVIEDSGAIVKESDKIIDYLDNKYDKNKLYPNKANKEEWDDVNKFKELISNLPVGPINYGCYSSDYKKHVKMDQDFVDKCISTAKGKGKYLEKMAEKYPEFAEIYKKKSAVANQLDLAKTVRDLDKNVGEMRKGLKEIDAQLAKMEGANKEWLCTNHFSVADIYLCVVLYRMDLCGLAGQLWEVGDDEHGLPRLASYFKRAMRRPSVQKMTPQYKLGAPGAD